LRLAAGALGPVGRRWRLVLAWDAWGWAVQVSQGQRGEELRQRVLLKATFRLVGSGAVDPGENRTAAQGFHAPQDSHAALRMADLALTLWAAALHTWAHTFLPMAAEARARAAWGASHWRRRLLRVALEGWMTEAARLAVQRGWEAEADAFAAASRLDRSFEAWALGLRLQRSHRARKAAALAAARQQLAKKQTTRLLAAWREVTVHWLLKSLQAQVMAAELALVEPYARRWRRLAQASSAHRSRCASLSPFWAAPSHPHTPTLP
ncbi:uncharacterized protein HaLaN_17454, partial [Haematococcus lacustris]